MVDTLGMRYISEEVRRYFELPLEPLRLTAAARLTRASVKTDALWALCQYPLISHTMRLWRATAPQSDLNLQYALTALLLVGDFQRHP